MGILKFVTGTVACGKTAQLLINAHQLVRIHGSNAVCIMKPLIDTRFGENIVRSASGLQTHTLEVASIIDDLYKRDYKGARFLFVDEIQFFTIPQIEQLRRLSIDFNIDVFCFGLLKDFRCEMFASSKRLLELCDHFEITHAYCNLCKDNQRSQSLATCSMKTCAPGSAKADLQGDAVCIGGIETFIPVCHACYVLATECLEVK